MADTKIIDYEFSYNKAAHLNDALRHLQEKGTRILAGGTDLIVRIKTDVEKPTGIIDISDVEELQSFVIDGKVEIGAAVKLSSILKVPVIRERYMGLYEAIDSIGAVQIRNLATLAGNLCNASPGADSAPPLLTLEASVEVASLEGENVEKRVVPLREFFTGPGKTILKSDELVTKIIIPSIDSDSGSAFKKISRVKLDIAKISCAVYLVAEGQIMRDIRIAVGAASAKPKRAESLERELKGKKFEQGLLEEKANLINKDISPITDIRSTEEYRRNVAPVLVRDTIELAWKRAKGAE